MREFIEIINEYPWTSFFIFYGALVVFETILRNVRKMIKRKC